MRLLERKTPIDVDLGGRKLNKEFDCPFCGEKTKITRPMVMNAGGNVVTTCVLYDDYAEPINKYHKNPKAFKDSFEYLVPLARAVHNLGALSQPTLSLATSIELPCGHKIPTAIECGIPEVEEPKKKEVLYKLGLDTKNAWRWLSYIYTGRVNEKFGKKKADEVMHIINSYHNEKAELERFQAEVNDKVPASITGLDGRLQSDVSTDIQAILRELDMIVKSVIHDLDETLARVAMRPEGGLPIKSWVAKGATT